MELPPANPLRDTLVKLKVSFETLLDEPLELTTIEILFDPNGPHQWIILVMLQTIAIESDV